MTKKQKLKGKKDKKDKKKNQKSDKKKAKDKKKKAQENVNESQDVVNVDKRKKKKRLSIMKLNKIYLQLQKILGMWFPKTLMRK